MNMTCRLFIGVILHRSADKLLEAMASYRLGLARQLTMYVYTWYFMYRALGVILCNRERDLLPYHTKFGSPKYGPKVHILRNVLTSFAQQRMSQPPASCLSSGTHTLDVQFSTRVLRAPSVEAFGQVSGSPRTVSIRCCCAGRSFVRAIYL